MNACKNCATLHNLSPLSPSFVKVGEEYESAKASCEICGKYGEYEKVTEPLEAVPRRSYGYGDDGVCPRCPHCGSFDQEYADPYHWETVECYDCGKEYEYEVEMELQCRTYPID